MECGSSAAAFLTTPRASNKPSLSNCQLSAVSCHPWFSSRKGAWGRACLYLCATPCLHQATDSSATPLPHSSQLRVFPVLSVFRSEPRTPSTPANCSAFDCRRSPQETASSNSPPAAAAM